MCHKPCKLKDSPCPTALYQELVLPPNDNCMNASKHTGGIIPDSKLVGREQNKSHQHNINMQKIMKALQNLKFKTLSWPRNSVCEIATIQYGRKRFNFDQLISRDFSKRRSPKGWSNVVWSYPALIQCPHHQIMKAITKCSFLTDWQNVSQSFDG